MTAKKSKIGAKKVISYIGTALSIIIFALAIYVVISIIVCNSKNKPVSIFGSSFAIVQTGSMEPTIMTGDLIVYHAVDYENVKEGDVIVFVADESFTQSLQGKMIVHRVVEITEEGLITRGDNNTAHDGGVRSSDEVLGVCTYNSAALGKIFSFLGAYWIVIVDVIIAIPLIISLILKITRLISSGDEVNESGKIIDSMKNVPDSVVDTTSDDEEHSPHNKGSEK